MLPFQDKVTAMSKKTSDIRYTIDDTNDADRRSGPKSKV